MDSFSLARLIASVIFAASATACATNESRYLSMPEQQLCIDYLTYPSINIHQRAREEAIRMRSINCTPYAEAANAKIRANQALDQQIRDMRRTYTAPTKSGAARAGATAFFKRDYVSGMNRVCVYDQMGSELVITVGAADICKLSYP